MKLSVIIPVYNEAKTIKEILQKIQAINLEKEIVIVNDGSTDGSKEILAGLGAKAVRVIDHARSQGKGMAIRTALQHVTGDIVIIQDADLEYDPQDYYALIKPITDGRAEVVYGSRFLKAFWPTGMDRFNWLGNRLFTLLANLLYNARITDEATCYKVFKADILKKFKLNTRQFDFCPEFTAKIRKAGYNIFEVPISYLGRKYEYGKKISWWDGIVTIWTLFKYRFVD